MERGSLSAIVDTLKKHNVPFVIVGGHAVNFYGYIRATEDCDIVFLKNAESVKALLCALTELEAHWISNEIDRATGLEKAVPVGEAYVRSTHLMMLETNQGYLDIFDYIPGHPNDDPTALFESASDTEYPFVSLRWLRKMKEAAGRTRDLDDLDNLPNP